MSSYSRTRSSALTISLSGMLAAMVFIATAYLKLPVSITQGYIHLGDGFILLGAALLGWPAVAAAAIGSALADLLGGYTMYILPTLLIKAAVAAIAVPFARTQKNLLILAVGFTLAEAAMVAGYFVVEAFFLGYGVPGAAGAILPNIVQGLSGVIIGTVLTPVMRRVRTTARL